jgi:hypothetical protein
MNCTSSVTNTFIFIQKKPGTQIVHILEFEQVVQPIIEHGTVGTKTHAEVEFRVYPDSQVVQTIAEVHVRQFEIMEQDEHKVVASP